MWGKAKQKLLSWVALRLLVHAASRPYKHLWHADGRPYMKRYWLLKLGRGRKIDGVVMPRWLGARLHWILSSDDDRAYHDHPWWFITIILAGGYWEHRPFGDGREPWTVDIKKWHGPGSILLRRARDWHRLELPEGKDAMTLFIHGRRSNGWGFLKDGRKIPWRDFEGEVNAGAPAKQRSVSAPQPKEATHGSLS